MFVRLQSLRIAPLVSVLDLDNIASFNVADVRVPEEGMTKRSPLLRGARR
jgi:hypothetical protein